MLTSTTPAPLARAAEADASRLAAALGWCLVTSGDGRVRNLLKQAARQGGWQTRVCKSPDEAVREAVLHRVPLALVDVGAVADRTKHAELMRLVRSVSEGLVVVCDHTANVDGELWARQEGAWVYLSGVDETSNIATVCLEARELMSRRLEGVPAGKVF